MQNLKVTLIQSDIVWENRDANLENFYGLINKVESTDLIILPEMFTTGFSVQPEKLSETMDGVSVNWMKKVAKEKNSALLGSIIIQEDNHYFNRAIWVYPGGETVFYNKRHLFSMGQEDVRFTAGKEKLIVEYKGWRFCPLICYDLRFPVWSRNSENYDVLIYLANWPAARHHVWQNLLVARAIENQSYCIGVNRTGSDGAGINYSGHSVLVQPRGFEMSLGELEKVETFTISLSELHSFRKKFPLLNDADNFEI